MPSFEILEHTADIGFHAWGATPAELFENAARALVAIAADTSRATADHEWPLDVDGEDLRALLVNFLNEILYLFDAGRFVMRDVVVETIEPASLHARLLGEPRIPARHPWRLIVKAVTYHGLEVEDRDGQWHAQVFLDV